MNIRLIEALIAGRGIRIPAPAQSSSSEWNEANCSTETSFYSRFSVKPPKSVV